MQQSNNQAEGKKTEPSSNPDDRSIGVNIAMPIRLLRIIDEKRGNMSRSSYVREALDRYLVE